MNKMILVAAAGVMLQNGIELKTPEEQLEAILTYANAAALAKYGFKQWRGLQLNESLNVSIDGCILKCTMPAPELGEGLPLYLKRTFPHVVNYVSKYKSVIAPGVIEQAQAFIDKSGESVKETLAKVEAARDARIKEEAKKEAEKA